MKHENGDENFIERVRVAIQQKLTGQRPTIDDIADVLHTSSRTLQRRLQDEGSSFQRVLEEARHQLARHYLNNSVLELKEAAYLLGYEDGNSFVRAFLELGRNSTRSLAGETPRQHCIVTEPNL
jgi:AraC-like DNA-binding protein